jgi:hypothetical protein
LTPASISFKSEALRPKYKDKQGNRNARAAVSSNTLGLQPRILMFRKLSKNHTAVNTKATRDNVKDADGCPAVFFTHIDSPHLLDMVPSQAWYQASIWSRSHDVGLQCHETVSMRVDPCIPVASSTSQPGAIEGMSSMV